MVALKRFKSEPERGFGPLHHPAISRPHFAFPTKFQGKAWSIRWIRFNYNNIGLTRFC